MHRYKYLNKTKYKKKTLTCLSDKLKVCESSDFLLIVMYLLYKNSFSSSTRCGSEYTTRYLSLVLVLPTCFGILEKKKNL